MTLERKFGSLSVWFFNSWHKVKWVFFWSCVSRQGTNFAATHLMFKSTVKIRWQELQLTPVASEISSIVYQRSSLIFSLIFSTFSLVWLVDGRPEWGWFSALISPLLNHANHSKICVQLSASSLKAFWSISCASVAVFPRCKQSQADSLFSTVRHHDFARGAWQHLGELTTQARTTFYSDVRLAADSWRVQLHSPSGGTLNYATTIRKSSPKPVQFFFGSTLVLLQQPQG